MKKIFVLAVLICVLGASFVATALPAQAFSGSGLGTSGSPYEITSCAQFGEINNALGAQYVLMQDLNCAADGNEVMVGTDSTPFTGGFDGGEYTITFNIGMAGYYMGPFRYTLNATIENFTSAGSVTGMDNTGGIVGYASGGTFYNLISIVSVDGNESVGGVFGYINNAQAEEIFNDGDVTGSGFGVGGVAGTASSTDFINSTNTGNVVNTDPSSTGTGGFVGAAACDSTYENITSFGDVTGYAELGGIAGNTGCEGTGPSFISVSSSGNITGTENVGGILGVGNLVRLELSSSSANVKGTRYVGGLLGRSWGYGLDEGAYTLVSSSFSTGDVVADSGDATTVGGLVGVSDWTIITNSYALNSSVAAAAYVGGLIGLSNDTVIDNSYAANTPSGVTITGGLVGAAVGSNTVEDSFWDTIVSDTTYSPVGIGKTTSEMNNIDTFDAWDFDNIWGISSSVNNGYPCLRWASEICTAGIVDGDSDTIDNDIENSAPNGGDANGDSTADSNQANVASFVSSITNDYVTVELDAQCSITAVGATEESALGAQDADHSYPYGVVDFEADCGTNGFATTVNMYFHDVDVAQTYVARKFTSYNNLFQTLSGATISTVSINGANVVKLSYSLEDGGPLDDDQTVNGLLSDPAGIAVGPAAAPTTSVVPAPSGLVGSLPTTGSSSSDIVLYSLLILAAGVVIARVAHRRGSRLLRAS